MTPLDTRARAVVDRAMVARIATVSRNGRPNLNPLYFVCDGDRIWLGTAERTLAALNVAADPRVSILFEIERDTGDTDLLRVTGTARVRTDPDVLSTYRRRDACKYVITPAGLLNMAQHARQLPLLRRHVTETGRFGGPCVIEVEPDDAEFVSGP